MLEVPMPNASINRYCIAYIEALIILRKCHATNMEYN